MSEKKNILFLCTGNSCRSQMAEGWTNALHGESFQAFSAGVKKSSVDPLAAEAMGEAGIDISGQYSKLIEELPEVKFDYVVTLCDHARESCPIIFSDAEKIHKGFDDPPYLARDAASQEEALEHYRRVRNEIQEFVMSFPQSLKTV